MYEIDYGFPFQVVFSLYLMPFIKNFVYLLTLNQGVQQELVWLVLSNLKFSVLNLLLKWAPFWSLFFPSIFWCHIFRVEAWFTVFDANMVILVRAKFITWFQEAHKLLQPLDKTLKTMAIEFAEYQVSYTIFLYQVSLFSCHFIYVYVFWWDLSLSFVSHYVTNFVRSLLIYLLQLSHM